ncbi:YdbH family protein [Mannheimia sp. AT1]|uniref:YdbH family protein n=1 Tax=Mannheimia cairinae TaxID=3025936 RepID=A0ABT5MP77_9PAST|nr:YdbH family protein [Mannheimia cairinae]MDD0823975.1 YdbH family protein [Mannheimia cairinae]MDD0825291.1 YdbH family protein [Mannheimia cairinae]
MKRALTIIGGIIAIFIVVTAFLMSNAQLATTINWILPKDWKVQLPQGVKLGWQGSSLSQFKLSYQDCPLVSVDNTALTWIEQNRLSIDSVTIDYECLSLFPQTEDTHSATSLNALLAVIPDGEAIIHKLNWLNLPTTLNLRARTLLEHSTELKLSLFKGQINASLQQQAVEFFLNVANGQLKSELTYQPSETEQHFIKLSAEINDNFMQLPPHFSAEYQWQLPEEIVSNKSLQKGVSTIEWQSNEGSVFEGNWLLYLTDSPEDKFNFPFIFDGESLEIKQGRFDWSLTKTFPFHGFVNAKFTPNSIEQKSFFPLKTALRFSLLSQNEWGKGNIVISNEEGEITENSLNLPLRLTGNIKHGNFILYSSIPLDFQGEFDDLTLRFLPSSLLRITGKERYLTIEDLRFPLAGIRVDKYGVHGRLQAILKGESPDFEKINFHLDGYAHNFKVGTSDLFQKAVAEDAIEDSWKWRIWGSSNLKAFQSKINLSGRGQWHANKISLTEFIGNLSEVKLEGTTIPKTELALNEIIKFDTQKLTLNGEVSLKSPEIKFSYGGTLPKPEAKLAFNGNVENLNFKGIINTSELGPLRLFARRQLTAEASQIIGKLYWPEQSADGFQPLFPFRSQWIIKQGTIRGETAFSASIKNGFVAGGHLAIRNGGISLPSGEAIGIEFSLPYRYQNGIFNFGAKKPITVNIAQIKLGDLLLDNATMKINGYYPYTKSKPLNLNELSFGLFGGRLNVKRFALPQTELAYLNLEQMDFEKILSFLQYQQIELTGKANATFPFWLSGKPCYICDGLLTQAETSYLTFTPDLLKAMAMSGYTEQILLHLVDKSTITDFRSLINVGPTGDLVLNGKLALQSNEGKSKVNLNYNHQENMFDLWKLINYGSQFEQKLENYLYQKLE